MLESQKPNAHFCIRCGTALTTREEDGKQRQQCPACGWIYYPKPNIASAVAILQDGEVLLVLRKHDPFAGKWTLPSGFMEMGEDPKETAIRELQEELAVEIEVTGLIDVLMEKGDPRGLCLVVFYTGRIVNGEPKPGDDAAEVRAFPLDALPDDFAWKAHRQALEELRSNPDKP